ERAPEAWKNVVPRFSDDHAGVVYSVRGGERSIWRIQIQRNRPDPPHRVTCSACHARGEENEDVRGADDNAVGIDSAGARVEPIRALKPFKVKAGRYGCPRCRPEKQDGCEGMKP